MVLIFNRLVVITYNHILAVHKRKKKEFGQREVGSLEVIIDGIVIHGDKQPRNNSISSILIVYASNKPFIALRDNVNRKGRVEASSHA